MGDVLRADFINSLPQPILGRDLGKDDWWWPVDNFEVETGLCQIDVMGKLQARHVMDFSVFRDGYGVEHQPDDLFLEEGK